VAYKFSPAAKLVATTAATISFDGIFIKLRFIAVGFTTSSVQNLPASRLG
jgi:hypothetical protein